jgi:hypothetical protein
MRRLLHPAIGLGVQQAPFAPFAPNNIFERDVTGRTRSSDSNHYALKVANQCNYSNASYDYKGEGKGPRFYGYSGVGYSNATGLSYTKATLTEYCPTIFIVPGGQPTEKVTFVNASGEPESPNAREKLQNYFEAVPMPEVSKVPAATLVANGTDKHIFIWQPSTGKAWEMWRLEGKAGAWTFKSGAYTLIGESNGILPYSDWGARATSLALVGGTITMQDLVEVMGGGEIKHALGVALPATGPGWVSPALRSDAGAGNYFGFIAEKHEGETNPAYQYTDAVPEGSWFRFPPAKRPSEYGITKPIEAAVYEAVRKHGVFVDDGGGGPAQFNFECPLTLGTSYSWAKINPLAGAPFAGSLSGYGIPESWTYPSLPTITETLQGEGDIFAKMPWQTLELLEPFSS